MSDGKTPMLRQWDRADAAESALAKAEAENRALLALVARIDTAGREVIAARVDGDLTRITVAVHRWHAILATASDPIAAGLAILTAVEDRLIERVVACIEAGPLAPAPNHWWGSRVASAVYGVDEAARGQAGEAVREEAAKRCDDLGASWQSLDPRERPVCDEYDDGCHAVGRAIRSLDITTIVTRKEDAAAPWLQKQPCGMTTTECQRSGGCEGRLCDVSRTRKEG